MRPETTAIERIEAISRPVRSNDPAVPADDWLSTDQWVLALAWLLVLGWVGYGWIGAEEIGLTMLDRRLGGVEGPAQIRLYIETHGPLYRVLSWPVVLWIEGAWAPGNDGPMPLGLLLYALAALLFGRAVRSLSGQPVALPVAAAFLIAPLAPVVFTSIGAAINFVLAGTVAAGHAAAVSRWGRSGTATVVAIFSISALLSFLTYELSLFFIVASAIAIGGWQRDSHSIRRKGVALAAVAVLTVGFLAMGQWRSPKLEPMLGGDGSVESPTVALDYVQSRSRSVLPWMIESTATEARSPVRLALAAVVAAAAALSLFLPILSSRGLGILAIVTFVSLLSPVLQPVLVIFSLSSVWRVSAKLVVFGGAMGMAGMLLLIKHRFPRSRVATAGVAVVICTALLVSSGLARNTRAACRLPADVLASVHVTPTTPGIVRVEGRIYHIAFARRLCRRPGR